MQSIKSLLDKKEGLVKSTPMGKRQNYVGRTIIYDKPKNTNKFIHLTHTKDSTLENGIVSLTIEGDYFNKKFDCATIPSSVRSLTIKKCIFDIEKIPSTVEELYLEDSSTFELSNVNINVKKLTLISQDIKDKSFNNTGLTYLKLCSPRDYIIDNLNYFQNLRTLIIEKFSSLKKIKVPKTVTTLELSEASYQENFINNFLDNIEFPSNLKTFDVQDYYVKIKIGVIPETVEKLTIWGVSKYMSIEDGAIPNSVIELYLYYTDQQIELYIEPWSKNNYPQSLKLLRESKTDLNSNTIPNSVKKLYLEYKHYDQRELEPLYIPNSVEVLTLSYNTFLKSGVVPYSVRDLTFVEDIVALIIEPNVIPDSVEIMRCTKPYEKCIEQLLPKSIKKIYHPCGVIIPFVEEVEMPCDKTCKNYTKFEIETIEIKFNKEIDKTLCFVCDGQNDLENCCDKCQEFICHLSCCKFGYYSDFKRCPMCYELFSPPETSVIIKEPISIDWSKVSFELKPVLINHNYINNNESVLKLEKIKKKLNPFQYNDRLYLASPFNYSMIQHQAEMKIKDLKSDINLILKKRYLYKTKNEHMNKLS